MHSNAIATRDPQQLLVIIDELDARIEKLEEENRLLRYHRFAASRDYVINPNQDDLCKDAVSAVAEIIEAVEKDSAHISAHRRRRPRKRMVMADHQPQVREEIDLPADEKTCPCCQSPLTRIGEDVAKKVEYVPASLTVKAYVRFNYACKHCDGYIQRAPKPKLIAPKSLFSASLLAYIIVSKFVDSLPLNRNEKQFARLGLTLPRGLQCRALLNLADQFKPVIHYCENTIRDGPAIHTDDTVIAVGERYTWTWPHRTSPLVGLSGWTVGQAALGVVPVHANLVA